MSQKNKSEKQIVGIPNDSTNNIKNDLKKKECEGIGNKKIKNNLSDKRFGKLVVVDIHCFGGNGKHNLWNCICDCGNRTIAGSSDLKTGHKKSCGCFKIERKTTHGMTRTPIYKSWQHMMGRCCNKNDKAYKDYGGRGIKVCDRWLESFENFYEDMGDKPDKLEIDRIDNNKGYYKENCRWATKKQQSRNRRSNIFITFNNKTQCLQDWSVELNINYKILQYRVSVGWSFLDAISIPIKKFNYKNKSRISLPQI